MVPIKTGSIYRRNCLQELLSQVWTAADLSVAYKTTPVYVVLDDGDRKRQDKERARDEKKRKKEAEVREIKRREREEEERVREVAAKKQMLKEKHDRESTGFSKAVVFQSGMSMPEFIAQYGTEAQCEMALAQARWPQGFRCPRCGSEAHGVIHDDRAKRFQCGPAATRLR